MGLYGHWEWMTFALIGLFLIVVYLLREWLLWRGTVRRRRRLLSDAQLRYVRPNVRGGRR